MNTLDAQLRALAEHADESMPWVDPLDIVAGTKVVELPPMEPVRPLRRPRSWLVAGAAAVAVVFVLAGPLLFQASDGERSNEPTPSTSPAVSGPATTVVQDAAPTTSVSAEPGDPISPLPAILASELVWTEVTAWSGPVPHWITEYPEGGFVASGFRVAPRYSTDGVTWTAEAFDATFDDVNDVYFAGEFALVNSSSDWEGTGSATPWPGRGWLGGQWEALLRHDGESWQPVDLPNLVTSTPLINAAPVVSGDMVLVQLEYDIHGRRYALSTGGGPFELHNGPPADRYGFSNLPQVVALPIGFGVYDETGTFWTSRDGVEWTVTADLREQASERPSGPYVIGFASVSDGAVGQVWTDDTVGWRTNDGLAFEEFDGPASTGGDPGPRYVISLDDYLIVAELTRVPKLWATSNTQEWTPLPSPEPRPARSGPETGRMAITQRALFYWNAAGSGEVVLQIATPSS